MRARILTGIGIMLSPLLGLAAGALLGINSVNGSFKDVVEEVIEELGKKRSTTNEGQE